jgi:hypothetical protein
MRRQDKKMPVKTLTGRNLFNAVSSGAIQVIENREKLNSINVFPVPDSDTGSNLAVTLDSILQNTEVSQSAGSTLRSISEQALKGARGNSGIIFAQFLCGLSDAVHDKKEITIDAFVQAVNNASEKAYTALSTPVEGTMLTVMREWSESILNLKGKISDYAHLFSESMKTALSSLKHTPDKLRVLKDNHVVDAGAKGFVHFLEGMTNFLKTGHYTKRTQSAVVKQTKDSRDEISAMEEISYRYCTEAVVETYPDIKERQSAESTPLTDLIRKRLQDLGDSLITAGSEEVIRIHIHSDRPDAVMERLSEFGRISAQKADDMVRQFESRYNRKYSIALVTDSVCDLPGDIMDRYQIHMVPLNIIMNDTSYLDKVSMRSDQFYRMLDETTSYPTTSQPPVSVFQDLYGNLLKYYDSVISIHLSAKMSGTWNAARQAAEACPEGKISVIDSRQLSGSLGLIVQRAAEAIDAGKKHDEIVEAVESWREKAAIFVSVQTLKYMVRGGRVSPMKGRLAKILNLKPIVAVDKEGKSELFGKAFSRKANRKKIIKMVQGQLSDGPLNSYAVVHAHARNDAKIFIDELKALLGRGPDYVMDISPVVGLNAGKGAVSVVTLKE